MDQPDKASRGRHASRCAATTKQGDTMLYIDNSYRSTCEGQMCNLTADTLEELHVFARELELNEKLYVDSFIARYSVPKNTRKQAIELGAIPVQYRDEPWRCTTCHRSTLPHTRILRCECKNPQTKNASQVVHGATCGPTKDHGVGFASEPKTQKLGGSSLTRSGTPKR